MCFGVLSIANSSICYGIMTLDTGGAMNKVRWKQFREDYRFIRGCSGKQQFPNKRVAESVRRRIGDETLNAYKCRFCGKHHLGHSKWTTT